MVKDGQNVKPEKQHLASQAAISERGMQKSLRPAGLRIRVLLHVKGCPSNERGLAPPPVFTGPGWLICSDLSCHQPAVFLPQGSPEAENSQRWTPGGSATTQSLSDIRRWRAGGVQATQPGGKWQRARAVVSEQSVCDARHGSYVLCDLSHVTSLLEVLSPCP